MKDGKVIHLYSLHIISRKGCFTQKTGYFIYFGSNVIYPDAYVVHAKLCMLNTVIVGANLHCFNFKCANWYCFSCIFCHQFTLKNIRRGYAQQKELKTGITKITRDMHSWNWFYFLIELAILQVIMTLNNHWLDP